MEAEQKKMQIKLGNRLRQLRLQKGHKSLEAFAYRTNISRVLYSNYESGKGNPTLKNICKVAKGLNISLKELFSEGV